MKTLAERIASLEAEIDGYVVERDKSNDKIERKELLDTITAGRNVLKNLLDQQCAEMARLMASPAPAPAVSFDEATISIIVERLGKVIISSTLQQTHRSPIPPTSFAYFTAQMYEGVVAQRVPQLTTIAFDMTTTEEVMNAAIWPVLAAGGEVLEDDILVINTERYTWLPCTDEEANDLKPDFAVVHRAFFQPVPDAGERTGRVHEWFVDQVLAVDEGKTTPLNGESKGRLLRYLHHLRIAGMREVKGLLFNGTDMHYVWMDSDNIGRVTESKWTADSASLLRSWSVPYRYPPLTEAIIKLCSQLGLRIHTGTTGAVLGKGLCGSCGWRTGAS